MDKKLKNLDWAENKLGLDTIEGTEEELISMMTETIPLRRIDVTSPYLNIKIPNNKKLRNLQLLTGQPI